MKSNFSHRSVFEVGTPANDVFSPIADPLLNAEAQALAVRAQEEEEAVNITELLEKRLAPAERAKTILGITRNAVLSAVLPSGPGETGSPYGLVVPIALDVKGWPMLILREEMRRVLRYRPGMRVSLTAQETPLSGSTSGVPGSVTVAGMLYSPESEAVTQQNLSELTRLHPAEAAVVRQGEAYVQTLSTTSILLVSPFGEVNRVPLSDYREAKADALGAAAPGLAAHLMGEERDSLVMLARAFAGEPDAQRAELVGLDEYGLDLIIETSTDRRPCRVPLSHPALSPDELRREIATMVKAAAFKLA